MPSSVVWLPVCSTHLCVGEIIFPHKVNNQVLNYTRSNSSQWFLYPQKWINYLFGKNHNMAVIRGKRKTCSCPIILKVIWIIQNTSEVLCSIVSWHPNKYLRQIFDQKRPYRKWFIVQKMDNHHQHLFMTIHVGFSRFWFCATCLCWVENWQWYESQKFEIYSIFLRIYFKKNYWDTI